MLPYWPGWRASILIGHGDQDGTVNGVCSPVDVGFFCLAVSAIRLPMSFEPGTVYEQSHMNSL